MTIDIAEVSHVKNVLVHFTGIVTGKHGYVSVTEWSNGEGWDVSISEPEGNEYYFAMSYEAWKALRRAVDVMEGKRDEEGRKVR